MMHDLFKASDRYKAAKLAVIRRARWFRYRRILLLIFIPLSLLALGYWWAGQ